jgi:multidrug efflux system outer membrane protein
VHGGKRGRQRCRLRKFKRCNPGTLGRGLLASPLLVSLVSCANLIGSEDYKRPEVPAKTEWSQQTGKPISASEIIRPDWWSSFQDAYLDSLVQQAVAENIDLRIAVARIEKAGAEVGGAEARSLPTLTVGGQAQVLTQGTEAGSKSFRESGSQYAIGGAGGQGPFLNWEIDIWGKLAKGTQAAEASYKATEADWRATYLTLVSDVANIYFLIRLLDEQIDQQQRTLANNQQILAIYELQLREGIASSTQMLSQKGEINRLSNELLDLRRQRALAVNSLATLLGKPAGNFSIPPGNLLDNVHLVEVPTGLPSDLLSRRPDIVAAEYRIVQSYQLVGESKLALLPSISLTSQGGLVSTMLSSLVKTWTFGIGPSINIPLFDPNLQANVKIREAENKEVAQVYRKTVLTAFQEVEDALTNLAYHRQQKEQLEEQVANLRTVRNQVEAQLQAGIVSQLQVFETERSLLVAEQSLLAIYQQILSDTVTLYKALGGGWPKESVKA